MKVLERMVQLLYTLIFNSLLAKIVRNNVRALSSGVRLGPPNVIEDQCCRVVGVALVDDIWVFS